MRGSPEAGTPPGHLFSHHTPAMKRQLFKSLLQLSLGPAWLEAKRRVFLCRQLTFGSEAWAVFDQIVLPVLLETRDPVVLALRRLVSLDAEGLSSEHAAALEQAGLRPYGFLYLVFWEAVASAELPSLPTPVPVYPFQVVLELLNEEAENTECDRKPEFCDLKARVLAATAHRLIRQQSTQWRVVLLQAWADALVGTGDPQIFTALYEAYADGCELQGRYAEAERIRQSMEHRRNNLPPRNLQRN